MSHNGALCDQLDARPSKPADLLRIDLAVGLDQYDTLYASQARFTGFEDVVDRLLPWHIWQVPEEELTLPSEERDAAGAWRMSC